MENLELKEIDFKILEFVSSCGGVVEEEAIIQHFPNNPSVKYRVSLLTKQERLNIKSSIPRYRANSSCLEYLYTKPENSQVILRLPQYRTSKIKITELGIKRLEDYHLKLTAQQKEQKQNRIWKTLHIVSIAFGIAASIATLVSCCRG